MRAPHFILALFALTIVGCMPEDEEPLLDTKYKIAYKLVDGSWDTSSVVGPAGTKFWVNGSDGTYSLVYAWHTDRIRQRIVEGTWKDAVIDFDVISEEKTLDTTTRRVELDTNALKPVELNSDPLK